MAKDPAFLFYSSDFISGTVTMTDEQVGKYIRLLCLLHQKGRLSEKHVLNICGRYDEDIFSKLKRDEQGLYYNEKLEDVVQKRKAYSESRRKNRNSKKPENPVSQTYVRHMETENEIITPLSSNTKLYKGANFSKNREPHYPQIQEVVEYFATVDKSEAMAIHFFNYYEGLGWRKNNTPIINWRSFALTAMKFWDWTKIDQQTGGMVF